MLDHTTFKGDVAEILAASELVARGYIVARPLTNGAAYDLLVDKDGKILRIQIKRLSRHTNGTLRVNLAISKYHRGRTRVVYHGRIDFLIGVECETRRFYVFSGDDLKHVGVAIRDTPARNNQTAGVRLAADYGIEKVFPDRHQVQLNLKIQKGISIPEKENANVSIG